ncbi:MULTISPECIES: phosphate ABC transporter ATP-binding protein [unclassified Sporosarcina]|uniref:ABC transporter ATP-binding protein n=1 Tax=unclassified Sporosarcina TaxID=2647733 RepID=UPI000C16EFA6|nr:MULTISPECIES: phosphate ABC transporter ATP-binding protein [unclassified Sporosarcina]PIC99982.1 phosphate ABC transporter ATP-binding protein [Sporosarcina sp. P29]PID04380.1 phosphate ABC transporter ATP-binding protein [Sporosarcina sp. P30]PID07558.1 phosphate ABC transporter ATP-binding protein [Sporosarcina sp. P31]PID10765.1 phosphate ABC transporter ATP-binding protein [Sporosarcina sp. P32b]
MDSKQNKSLYEPAIHFQHVSFEVGDTKILDSITGSFPTNQITVLVGPSGAGKTTLLKMCNGLLSPTSGDITVQGRAIHEMSPIDLRRKAGMVLQNSPMLAGSVYDNLALPLRLQGKTLSKEKALDILDQVGLEGEYLERDSQNLSGGQQQKVSIARTLMNESKILLMDEITSALDPSSLNEVEDLIRTLHEKHEITVIWITHNLEQAKRMGQYAWIMVDGKLVDAGEISVLDHSDIPSVDRFLKGDFS